MLSKLLFAFDVWFRQRRGDFDLCNFTVRLATSFEFHFLPGIGARAEKQDPRDLAVNIDLVKALIEIVRCARCPLFSLESRMRYRSERFLLRHLRFFSLAPQQS